MQYHQPQEYCQEYYVGLLCMRLATFSSLFPEHDRSGEDYSRLMVYGTSGVEKDYLRLVT